MSKIAPEHFLWSLDATGVGTVTLNRPERKNPLTFESYAELRDTFRSLSGNPVVKASSLPAPEAISAPGGTCTR